MFYIVSLIDKIYETDCSRYAYLAGNKHKEKQIHLVKKVSVLHMSHYKGMFIQIYTLSCFYNLVLKRIKLISAKSNHTAIYICILARLSEITSHIKAAWPVCHVSSTERFQTVAALKSYNCVIFIFKCSNSSSVYSFIWSTCSKLENRSVTVRFKDPGRSENRIE